MQILINQEHIIWLLFIIISFVLGYILGKSTREIHNGVSKLDKQFNKNNQLLNSFIKIDETKFVTEINTDSMEKKFESLGDKTLSNDNLSESVNKLKNLKR